MQSFVHSWLSIRERLSEGQDLDAALEAFDQAWADQGLPSIRKYVRAAPHCPPTRLLAELVKVDLEYRWRLAPAVGLQPIAATVEGDLLGDEVPTHRVAAVEELCWCPTAADYTRLFPELAEDLEMLAELTAEEFRARRLWGGGAEVEPFAVEHPEIASRLLGRLWEIADQTSTRQLPAGESAAGSEPPLEHLAAGQVVDDFRLLRDLGRGAFARVFLAQQLSMQRMVALKASSGPSVESPLLSRLDHPNIVRVFDERRCGELTLLYMQYVPAGSLRAVVGASRAAGGEASGHWYARYVAGTLAGQGELGAAPHCARELERLTWGETVAWIGTRLAYALAHAHSQGVWHRDVKPENVLIAADGRPMLADFNLSFGVSATGGRRQEFGGSLPYMSPEHVAVLLGEARPDHVAGPSDIYAFAVVLWELLAGRRPFPDPAGDGDAELLAMRRDRMVPPEPPAAPHTCPAGLREMLRRCLSADPAERYTAAEAVRALHRSTLPQLDRLYHPPPGSRSARWRAHPIGWLIALGLIPNALCSALNIWANHRLIIGNFDPWLFHYVEEPVINAIAFPAGVIAAVLIIRPVVLGLRAIDRGGALPEAMRREAALRSLETPAMAAGAIFLLWFASGLAFPLWNRLSPESSVNNKDVLGFLLSQSLHGIIAAGSTFVVIGLMSVRTFYPQFAAPAGSTQEQRELDRFETRLAAVTNALAVTPLLAILALAGSEQLDQAVFVALALAGFAGHLLSSAVAPKIYADAARLRYALSPTDELLQQNPPG